MTGKLSTLDIAVVVAYVAIVLAAGLFMGRFVKNTKSQSCLSLIILQHSGRHTSASVRRKSEVKQV